MTRTRRRFVRGKRRLDLQGSTIQITSALDTSQSPKTVSDLVCVGMGASGDVYRGIYANQVVAVKHIKSYFHISGTEPSEITIMRHLTLINAPNVVRYLDSSQWKQLADEAKPTFCLVMEYMDYGALENLIWYYRDEKFSWPMRIDLMADCARGLEFIHGVGLMHTDIKPANILIKFDGDSHRLIAKLGDFGLSYYPQSGFRRKRGTPHWMAPEVMQNISWNTFSGDRYSFSMVAWAIADWGSHSVYQQYQLNDDDDLLKEVLRDVATSEKKQMNRQPIPVDSPSSVVEVIHGGWYENPRRRTKVSDIIPTLFPKVSSPQKKQLEVNVSNKSSLTR